MYETEITGLAGDKSFARLRDLIRAADGLSLAQVCSFTGLEPTTVQNWIKRGFVPHPERKRYGERHVARILLIDALRECLQIDRVGELTRYINGDTDDIRDDIITEEALYELFNEAVSYVISNSVPLSDIGQSVALVVSEAVDDSSAAERIIPAMTVMVNARLASVYKREADKSYTELFNNQ